MEEAYDRAAENTAAETEEKTVAVAAGSKKSDRKKAVKKIAKNWQLYLMLLPGFLCLLVFSYIPMYGLTLAFKSYSPADGILGSAWVGFENFKYAVMSRGFMEKVGNTLALGGLKIVFAFPSSIILALMMNEVRLKAFKKTVQTLSYLPYFISWVIVSAILNIFLTKDTGVFNKVLSAVGLEPVFWYAEPKYWRAIITISGIWKNMGWGTIVFLAALTNINPELYEAARVDGAGYLRLCWHVTIPGIMPAIAMTFILSVSGIVKDDFEQIYALVGDSSILSPTTEVLGTWVYKQLHGGFRGWGDATAVSLVQSIAGFILVVLSNWFVKKTDNEGLW